MKVKLFSSNKYALLEEKINTFLETIDNVVDIKYSTSIFPGFIRDPNTELASLPTISEGMLSCSALIMYK